MECFPHIHLSSVFQIAAIVVVGFLSPTASAQQPDTPVADIAKLQSVIDRSDKVVVYDAYDIRAEREIYSSSDKSDLASLKSSITIEPPERWFQCACMASTVLRFYSRDRMIGSLAVFNGTTIRFQQWESDVRIADSEIWFEWLDKRGINTPRKEFAEESARAQEARAAEDRWMKAMPESFRPLWATVIKGVPVGKYNTTELDAALAKGYPDLHTRILRLMAWYGSGEGPWSGYPVYEDVAEQMLLKYSTSELVSALARERFTDVEAEGAARLFAGWEFSRTRPNDDPLIPADLKRQLLEHALRSTDKDKQARAKHAFRSAIPEQ